MLGPSVVYQVVANIQVDAKPISGCLPIRPVYIMCDVIKDLYDVIIDTYDVTVNQYDVTIDLYDINQYDVTID